MREAGRIAFSVLMAAILTTSSIAGLREKTVDCDTGQSLQKVLDDFSQSGGGRVLLSGTCGGVRLVTESIIQIVGESPETAIIQAGPGASIYAYGAGYLEIQNLRLEGGDGVWAKGTNRSVVVSGCEIEADWSGIRAESGAAVHLLNSSVSGRSSALTISGSSVYIENSCLHDSTFAARLFDGWVAALNTEVIDNEIGVLAENRSDVSVSGSRFTGNGQGHLGAIGDSRLTIANTQIGDSGDPTHLSIYADRGSAVEIFNDDPQIEIWGPATILNDSFMSIRGAMLHGSIAMRGFSRLLLDGQVLDGVVGCQSAADAWCGPTASAFSTGCASIAADSCVPDPDGTGGEIDSATIPEFLRPVESLRPLRGNSTIDRLPIDRGGIEMLRKQSSLDREPALSSRSGVR